MQPIHHLQHRFLQHQLQRACNIPMLLRQLRAALAWRPENCAPVGPRNPIFAFAPILENVAKQRRMHRCTERCQRHYLVFIGGMQKAEMSRDFLIQQAERIRQVDLPDATIFAVFIQAVAGGGGLAAAIHRQHRRSVERCGQKSTGFMRQMVVDIMPLKRTVMRHAAKAFLEMMRRAAGKLARRIDDIGKKQRIPRRKPGAGMARRLQRQADGRAMPACTGKQFGLPGIGNMLHVGKGNAGLFQAIVDCMERQFPGRKRQGTLAMLDAGKTLLFGCRHHIAIAHQASRAIMINSIDTQCVHNGLSTVVFFINTCSKTLFVPCIGNPD